VTLIEVGAIEITRGMRPRTEFEQDWREAQLQDSVARRSAFLSEFLERGTHEYTQR